MKLRFLTAGESHGMALVGILEGIPSQLKVQAKDIHVELLRRKLGYGRGARQKTETDVVKILSGVRHGKTLGSPIGLLIENKDWINWTDIMQVEPFKGVVKRELKVPRPGHADLVGGIKYAHSDMRNVLERASARETTMRVALGSVAKLFLKSIGVKIGSRVLEIGGISDSESFRGKISTLNARVDSSPVRCLGEEAQAKMVALIEKTKHAGDTLGGVFEVCVEGLPLGLGSYSQWDRRVEGDLAKAVMSLNAVKGVEIGLGFEAARRLGSLAHDEYVSLGKKQGVGSKTNYSGGIDGGMTNGRTLVLSAAMKPISTLMKPLMSVNLQTGKPERAHVERSDVCAVPAAAVISESLVALVLADFVLDKFGGDSMEEVGERVDKWNKKNE